MDFYEKLFQALKKDDKKEFDSCMATSYCGSLRLGRFPVLSVMYLYNARRLLFHYEKKFLKHNSWQDVGEPMELSAKFRGVAGKCLRLYLHETVSPVEMLLLLNRDFKVQRVCAQVRVTPPVKQRLKEIYYVRWGLEAEFVGRKIILARRPMTRAEKMRWFTSVVSVVLCVAIIVGTPFVVDVFDPFIPDSNGAITVTKWEQIKFTSNRTYALTGDITLSENEYVGTMNCELRGNGHTVTVIGNGLFGNINGKLKDIVFETNGSAVANNVNKGATVSNVTVNVAVDMRIDEVLGFFANVNNGDIANVSVNVTGALSAIAQENQEGDEDNEVSAFNCGGIVATNNKRISSCVANYNDFALTGESGVNAAFGGIVGTNNGTTEGCTTFGKISADTFDVAGICAENNDMLFNDANDASIAQRSDSDGWNPLAAGVVVINYSKLQYCSNSGSISSVLGAADKENEMSAYAAGIVGRAYGYVYRSVNTGDISAESTLEACAGGIVGSSCAQILECISSGNIDATGKSCLVGGILGASIGVKIGSTIYFGFVESCIADSEINVTKGRSSDSRAYVGGIVGLMQQDDSTYEGGSVKYSYFKGSLVASGAYVGAIVGVTGEKMYLASASEQLAAKKSFHGNVYADDCGVVSAFGAVFVDDDNLKTVEDIGASVATVSEMEKDTEYKRIMRIFA